MKSFQRRQKTDMMRLMRRIEKRIRRRNEQ